MSFALPTSVVNQPNRVAIFSFTFHLINYAQISELGNTHEHLNGNLRVMSSIPVWDSEVFCSEKKEKSFD